MKISMSILWIGTFLLVHNVASFANPILIDDSLTNAKEKAQSENKILLLKFGAKWCLPCRFMDQNVFENKEVLNFLNNNAVVFSIDVDDIEGTVMQQSYDVHTLPTMILLDPKGREINRKDESMGLTEFVQWVETQMKKHQIEPNPLNESQHAAVEIVVPSDSKDFAEIDFDPNKVVENTYYIQTGAFTKSENANQLLNTLKNKYKLESQIFEMEQNGKSLYKIALGSFETLEEAELFLEILKKEKVQGVIKTLF